MGDGGGFDESEVNESASAPREVISVDDETPLREHHTKVDVGGFDESELKVSASAPREVISVDDNTPIRKQHTNVPIGTTGYSSGSFRQSLFDTDNTSTLKVSSSARREVISVDDESPVREEDTCVPVVTTGFSSGSFRQPLFDTTSTLDETVAHTRSNSSSSNESEKIPPSSGITFCRRPRSCPFVFDPLAVDLSMLPASESKSTMSMSAKAFATMTPAQVSSTTKPISHSKGPKVNAKIKKKNNHETLEYRPKWWKTLNEITRFLDNDAKYFDGLAANHRHIAFMKEHVEYFDLAEQTNLPTFGLDPNMKTALAPLVMPYKTRITLMEAKRFAKNPTDPFPNSWSIDLSTFICANELNKPLLKKYWYWLDKWRNDPKTKKKCEESKVSKLYMTRHLNQRLHIYCDIAKVINRFSLPHEIAFVDALTTILYFRRKPTSAVMKLPLLYCKRTSPSQANFMMP